VAGSPQSSRIGIPGAVDSGLLPIGVPAPCRRDSGFTRLEANVNSREGHMMSSNSPTVRVARWSATHPWRAIGLWVAFVVSAIALMSTVQTKQVADEDFRV